MKDVEIVMTKKVNLKNHTLIDGFPGVGLVGTIAVSYIIEKQKMEPIGYITSSRFPPMTTIHKGRPYFPMRIYKHPTKNFCILLAEFVVPSDIVYNLSKEILNFAKKNKIRKIVSLAGMSMQKEVETKDIFGIASNDEMYHYLKTKGIKMIEEGVTTGVSGLLIAESAKEGFSAISLLVQSEYKVPDPRASAELLKILDDIIGLEVDTKELLKEATQIEKKMRGLMGKAVKEKQNYKEAEESPIMYG